jgi:pSer/pThr/pTyr-binding forkhead associated (FHA) protein
VDGWLFEDLGSENGTYLDDAYVKTGKVAYGQALEVGRSIIIIERGEPG